MLKVVGWLMLLVLIAVVADAQTYRCRRADGSPVFTDDPKKFASCKEVSESESKKGVSVVPMAPPAAPPPLPQVLGEQEKAPGNGEKPTPTLKDEAIALAEDYRQAVADRVPTRPRVKVQKARIRILEIQRFRDDLLKRVAEASLPDAEKAEIEKILAPIPASKSSAEKETEQPEREKGEKLEGKKLESKVREWKAEAKTLGEEYNNLVSRRSNPPFPMKVYDVEERLQEIRRRKYELLDELKENRLSPEDRAEIEKSMEFIPPPL